MPIYSHSPFLHQPYVIVNLSIILDCPGLVEGLPGHGMLSAQTQTVLGKLGQVGNLTLVLFVN